MTAITRRSFLQAALAAPLLQSGARLVGTVPLGLTGGASPPPFGRLLGPGLDARLFTDLSALSPDRSDLLITPTDQFYVRTAAPAALDRAARGWRPGNPPSIAVGGAVAAPVTITNAELARRSVDRGPYLMECAGNTDQSNYGLLSAATWEGAPMDALLDMITPASASYRVLVSGMDDTEPTRSSAPGASWIFSRADLVHALIAVKMNGAPLPRDHGSPFRLVVPGWYGCACIKWVDRIEIVADDAPATLQMREFAARTHQPLDAREVATGVKDGRPLLARDFVPAIIDTAAMPVRVEKWRRDGRPFYRIIGIVWGGSKPTNALSIRFKSGGAWEKVEDCPRPTSTLTWSLWTHTWRPEAPGRYQIVLKVDDPTIRTRRLDIFFYVREITIDEI